MHEFRPWHTGRPWARCAHGSVPGCCCLLTGRHRGGCSSVLMITAVGHRVLPPVPSSSLFHPLTIHLSHLSLSTAAHHQPDIRWGGGEAGGARDE